MALEGSIHNGEIVLDGAITWEEGTRIRIEAIPETGPQTETPPALPTLERKPIACLQEIKARLAREEADPSLRPKGKPLAETLARFIGCLDGLPEDASVNVDHYLYGHPKK